MNPAQTKASDLVVAPPSPRRPGILRWLERVLAVVGLCFILFHVCFELTAMTSESMAPTLRGTNYVSGERILVEKISGWFRSPRRWEVYFFYDADGTPVTKRIVGLPGERISLKDNRLLG